ncbi:effector-associated domain EAD1-containing protein [Gemmata sp. JC673]|uniref:Effector-associated domain EAD1-containing protein n=1 Tax=Gemmata algarum TaxID=2975278 RepID=A0ABU5EXH5_9BACT|nr:effector-associated domain EAD1-containing protein [Gemmata algarum]MDY3558401.1 effector-associated domain EAD1-containing protein [Gemmata algarum]
MSPMTENQAVPAEQALLTEAAERVRAVESLDLEGIVLRLGRPVLAVENDDISGSVGVVWESRLGATGVRDTLRRIIPAVGRIEVDNHPDSPYVGTGWLIADDIAVTAGFVAEQFAVASGPRYVFRPGAPNPLNLMVARLDFKVERLSVSPRTFAVREVLHIDATNTESVAFLRLEPFGPYGPLSPPLRLSAQPPAAGRHAAVIGYPAADARMDQTLVRRVFGDVFDVKRVALGQITGVAGATVRHDCMTAAGTAGAPIVDLLTGEVVGMHLGGRPFGEKFGVTAAVIAARFEAVRQAPRAAVPAAAAPCAVPESSAVPAADELIAALLGAFGFDALVRLAANELKVDLNAISPRGSTSDAIEALVRWAQQNGRIGDLFAAASVLRPNNPQLAGRPVGVPGNPTAAHELRQRLRGLLLDQFPKRSDLSMLLDDAVGVDLDTVAAPADELESVCYKVVKWLWIDPKDRLRPVVELAAERRRANTELRALLAELPEAEAPVH